MSSEGGYKILIGDAVSCLKNVERESVQTCFTSPPYFQLRDYDHVGQIGRESTPEAYVEALVKVFQAVKEVLRPDGTLWLNLGDSYARDPGKGQPRPGPSGGKQSHIYTKGGGTASSTYLGGLLKEKDLIGIPWLVAFALRDDGWYLRQNIIWDKPNAMPEPTKDRCVNSHEHLFLLSKSPRYYFDHVAIQEDAVCDRLRGPALHRDLVSTSGNSGLSRRPITGRRNRRSVWRVNTVPYRDAHFAAFPEELVRPALQASTRPGDLVLDPFAGSGTVGRVALQEGRRALLVDVNPDYKRLMIDRMRP
jgi:DNA modification methylase